MPFIQPLKITPPQRYQFNIPNYNLGLMNGKSSFEIPLNASPYLKNMISMEDGSIETRPGIFKYMEHMSTADIYRMFTYRTESVNKFILASDSKVYIVDADYNDGTGVVELCSCNDVISGVQIDTSFFFVDGAEYRVYDGTDIFLIQDPLTETGTAQAGGATTLTLASTANVNNDYYNGWYIYIASGTGVGQTRAITDYDGSSKVATVSGWTTEPDNTSTYYLTNYEQGVVTTAGANTLKVYTPTYQEYTDTALGPNTSEGSYYFNHLEYHANRLFFSAYKNGDVYNNTVSYTDLSTSNGNMYYLPTYAYLTASNNTIGTLSFNGVLAIFSTDEIYALYGFDYTDFELKKVTTPVGPINIDTVCKANNNVLFLGSDGYVYVMFDLRNDVNKVSVKNLTADVIDLSLDPIGIYSHDWNDSTAIFFDRYYILAIKDKILVYDGAGWWLWDNINPGCFLKHDTTLILFQQDTRYLYRFPFKRFLVDETFTAIEGQTDFTLLRSYIDNSEDVTVLVNSMPYGSIIKVDNDTFRLPFACQAGDEVTIEHLSMLAYTDQDIGAYEARWESKDLDFSYPTKIKQVRQFWLTAHTYTYFNSTINVDVGVDHYNIETGFTMNNQISLFGNTEFGDKFIINNIVDSKSIAVNRRGRIYRIKIYNSTADQPFKLYNIYGEITVRKK